MLPASSTPQPTRPKVYARALLNALATEFKLDSAGSDQEVEQRILECIEQLAGAALPYWNRSPSALLQDWSQDFLPMCSAHERTGYLILRRDWASNALAGTAPLLNVLIENDPRSFPSTVKALEREQAPLFLEVLAKLPDRLGCRVLPCRVNRGALPLWQTVNFWTSAHQREWWGHCKRGVVDIGDTLGAGGVPFLMHALFIENSAGRRAQKPDLIAQQWVHVWDQQNPTQAREGLLAAFSRINPYAQMAPIATSSPLPLSVQEQKIAAYTQRMQHLLATSSIPLPAPVQEVARQLECRQERIDAAAQAHASHASEAPGERIYETTRRSMLTIALLSQDLDVATFLLSKPIGLGAAGTQAGENPGSSLHILSSLVQGPDEAKATALLHLLEAAGLNPLWPSNTRGNPFLSTVEELEQAPRLRTLPVALAAAQVRALRTFGVSLQDAHQWGASLSSIATAQSTQAVDLYIGAISSGLEKWTLVDDLQLASPGAPAAATSTPQSISPSRSRKGTRL